jgi:hypothetical protein
VNCSQQFWNIQNFWYISFSLYINTIEHHTSFIVLRYAILHTTRPTPLNPSTPSSPFMSFPDNSKLAWKSFLPTLWKKTPNLLTSPRNPTGFLHLIHEVFELS